jgi:hypothetical protein
VIRAPFTGSNTNTAGPLADQAAIDDEVSTALDAFGHLFDGE